MQSFKDNKRLLCLVLAGAGLSILGWLLYRQWLYPYGWSHSRDKQLSLALYGHAEEHGGAFPAGEATPEASLSLLYPTHTNDYVLQGKTVPLETVKSILERGQRLDPNSCGWHYVEGLRLNDDPRLELFWNKAGLGHNGERNSGAGILFSSWILATNTFKEANREHSWASRRHCWSNGRRSEYSCLCGPPSGVTPCPTACKTN
jgi:hypothetical protein